MHFYWYRCLIKTLQNACSNVNKKRVGYQGDPMKKSSEYKVNIWRIKDVQDVNDENLFKVML